MGGLEAPQSFGGTDASDGRRKEVLATRQQSRNSKIKYSLSLPLHSLAIFDFDFFTVPLLSEATILGRCVMSIWLISILQNRGQMGDGVDSPTLRSKEGSVGDSAIQ